MRLCFLSMSLNVSSQVNSASVVDTSIYFILSHWILFYFLTLSIIYINFFASTFLALLCILHFPQYRELASSNTSWGRWKKWEERRREGEEEEKRREKKRSEISKHCHEEGEKSRRKGRTKEEKKKKKKKIKKIKERDEQW